MTISVVCLWRCRLLFSYAGCLLLQEVASLKKALAAEEESASALRDAIVSSTPRPEAEDSGSGVGVDEARSKELASLRGERDAYRSQLERVLRDMDIVRSQQSSVTSDRVCFPKNPNPKRCNSLKHVEKDIQCHTFCSTHRILDLKS